MRPSKVSLKIYQYRWISEELCSVCYVLRILSFAFLYQTVRRGDWIQCFMNSSKVSLKMVHCRWISVELCNVRCVLRILCFAILYQTVRRGEVIKYFVKSSKVSLNWINIDESLSSNVMCYVYSEYYVSPSCIKRLGGERELNVSWTPVKFP
jgi:hypothetical protein